jgi:hypothetical protein
VGFASDCIWPYWRIGRGGFGAGINFDGGDMMLAFDAAERNFVSRVDWNILVIFVAMLLYNFLSYLFKVGIALVH